MHGGRKGRKEWTSDIGLAHSETAATGRRYFDLEIEAAITHADPIKAKLIAFSAQLI